MLKKTADLVVGGTPKADAYNANGYANQDQYGDGGGEKHQEGNFGFLLSVPFLFCASAGYQWMGWDL